MAFLSKGKPTRYDKIASIAGPVVWTVGLTLEAISNHKEMITTTKGGLLSEVFEAELKNL